MSIHCCTKRANAVTLNTADCVTNISQAVTASGRPVGEAHSFRHTQHNDDKNGVVVIMTITLVW